MVLPITGVNSQDPLKVRVLGQCRAFPPDPREIIRIFVLAAWLRVTPGEEGDIAFALLHERLASHPRHQQGTYTVRSALYPLVSVQKVGLCGDPLCLNNRLVAHASLSLAELIVLACAVFVDGSDACSATKILKSLDQCFVQQMRIVFLPRRNNAVRHLLVEYIF